jgi:hypothetical protein
VPLAGSRLLGDVLRAGPVTVQFVSWAKVQVQVQVQAQVQAVAA